MAKQRSITNDVLRPDSISPIENASPIFSRRKLMHSSLLGAGALTLLSSTGGSVSFGKDSNDNHFVEFTETSKASIKKGTTWLLQALNKDGGAGPDIGTPSDPACTAVLGMALLSQGHTPIEGKYNRHQKSLADYMLLQAERSTQNGQLANGHSQVDSDLGMYASHFFTALFLSQTMGEARNVGRYFAAVQKLERTISGAQEPNGSWGDDAWAPILGSACGWLSLRAVNFAGIKVSGSSQQAAKYILKNMPRLGSRWGSDSWYHRFYGAASALRVLYSLEKENEPKAKSALKDILALLEKSNRAFGGAGGEEYLTFHLLTEMFLQKGGDQWQRWFPNVRDKLIKYQNSDGSWTGHHCITSRTFSTACALLTLTAPNRYLPISQV